MIKSLGMSLYWGCSCNPASCGATVLYKVQMKSYECKSPLVLHDSRWYSVERDRANIIPSSSTIVFSGNYTAFH